VTFPRQALHSQRLVVDHPAHGRRMEFTAPMADDLRELIDLLRRQARQVRHARRAP
jgi:23S rRNA pseudouridine1911/1915/1917 synthase